MRLESLRAALAALILCAAPLIAAPAAGQSELPAVAPQGRTPYVAVLVWHDVLPSKEVWFDTTTATFEQQLAAVAKGGFHVIALSALRDHFVTGKPIPEKSLV